MKDEMRAVIEAARAWYATRPQGISGGTLEPLADALDALDQARATAQPQYEELDGVAWMHVRDGDLVLAPDRNWYLVTHSVEGETPATQAVTMIVNGKTAGPYARPAEARVNVRRPIDEENRAIDALAAAFGDVRAIAPVMDWS